MFVAYVRWVTGHFISIKKRLMETATVRPVIMTMTMILGMLFSVRANIVPIYCQSHSSEGSSSSPSGTGRSGVRIKLQTIYLYHLNPYVRDAEADVKEHVVNCTWIFTVTGISRSSNCSRKAMTVVLELQRKGGGQVMAGDAISNLVISVDENGTTHPFLPNVTLLQVKSVLIVSLSAYHSRDSMDNALFIRMFLVSGDSCPDDNEQFHKYGDSCITARPASFICGASQHLSNCSLMAQLAIQASSVDKLTELVRSVSFNKEFSRHFLSSTTLVSGFLCKDGILLTCAARTAGSTGHGCRWRRSIPGKFTGLSEQCSTTSGLQYVSMRVTGDGKPGLSLVSSELQASQLSVLLDTASTSDHATEAPVPSEPSAHLMIGIVVAVLVTLGVAVLAGIIIYKLCVKHRNRDTNAGNTRALESEHGEQQVKLVEINSAENRVA